MGSDRSCRGNDHRRGRRAGLSGRTPQRERPRHGRTWRWETLWLLRRGLHLRPTAGVQGCDRSRPDLLGRLLAAPDLGAMLPLPVRLSLSRLLRRCRADLTLELILRRRSFGTPAFFAM